MRTSDKNQLNIISTINRRYLKGEISDKEALQFLKDEFPRTVFVKCVDDGQFHKKSTVNHSKPSNRYFSSSREFISINGASYEEDIYCHISDAEKIAFFCEFNQEWYKTDQFTKVNCEGDIVALEACGDNVECREGLYVYTVFDDNIDESGRADYHSTRRLKKNIHGIGVELEIECHDNMYDFCQNARKNKILTEYDGSLSDAYGVELIGPVMPFSAYQKPNAWNNVFDVCGKHKCKGHDAGKKYGIHVSMSLSLFSELELSKFVLFINTCDNLCKTVAQRDVIYGGDYKKHNKHKKFKKSFTGKYEAVRVDTVRAEVRIFRSTTRYDRFLKNIEFCEAVRNAIKELTAQEVLQADIATKKFLEFVGKAKKTYPNLYTFLVEKNLSQNRRILKKLSYNTIPGNYYCLS